MHYKNGRAVKLGDLVFTPVADDTPYPQTQFTGIVVSGNGQADGTCNLNLNVVASREHSPLGVSPWIPKHVPYTQSATAKECLHVADSEDAQPNPPGQDAPPAEEGEAK